MFRLLCTYLFLTIIPLFDSICSHWLSLREEKVVAKGKGEMTTYWLDVKSNTHDSKSSCSSRSGSDSKASAAEPESSCDTSEHIEKRNSKSNKKLLEKIDRLVDWNTDNLLRLLQQIVDRRQSSVHISDSNIDVSFKANPFDEVTEIISLPQEKRLKSVSADILIPVSPEVSRQLRDYVSRIASMYNDNYFHNFEHVSFFIFS